MQNFKTLLTPNDITDFTSDIGKAKACFKPWRTRLLSIMAGMFIALGGVASIKANIVMKGSGAASVVSAFLFTIGLLLVLVAGAELFTGNVLLTVARLDKKITTKQLLINWCRVYIWNLIGGVLFAAITFISMDKNDEIVMSAVKMIDAKTSYTFLKCIALGFLCNMIVCLAVWMSFGSRLIVGKMFVSSFPIMIFVFMKYEHIVANFFFYTLGLLGGSEVPITDILIKSALPVTIGNILGGMFISLIYYLSYHKN